MRKKLQNFFQYNRSEKNGIVALSFIITFLFLLPKFYPFFCKKKQIDFSEFKQQIADFEKDNIAMANINAALNIYEQKEETSKETKLFSFNPNQASKEDFLLLGISPKVAQTIINFRNKGGNFFKAEDLKKIYGLKDADYLRLKNYVQLNDSSLKEKKKYKNTEPKISEKKEIVLFNFDPNTVSEDNLILLGLSKRSIRNILKFRSKGGTFRKIDDLAKIYGLDKDQFLALKPYIQLEEKTQFAKNDINTNSTPKAITVSKTNYKSIKIDINKANSDDWQKLRGIGPAYAKRIVKFRDKLGGFSNTQQVSEIYGLPDSTFQSIKSQLLFSPIFAKININTANAEILKSHPYLSWKQANSIVKYRENHGKFSSAEDLKKIVTLEEKLVEKLSPYLAF